MSHALVVKFKTSKGAVTPPQDMKAGFKTSRIAVKPPLGVGQWHQITDEVVGTPRLSQTT